MKEKSRVVFARFELNTYTAGMNDTLFDPYDVTRVEISGIPVYWKYIPWAPCVHIQYNFSAGAFYDPADKKGVAHFLEHMVFNGSPLFPDKKALDEFSRLYMLKSKNAYTSHDTTGYVGRCLPEHFDRVIEAMHDYIFCPFLRDSDMEAERAIITQEAWRRYKNEKFLTYGKEISHILFNGHIHSEWMSPLGFPDSIARITGEDIRAFHRTQYIKERLAVFLVGNVTEAHLATLGNFLSRIPHGAAQTLNPGESGRPTVARTEKSSDEIGDPREQLTFSINRVTPPLDHRSESIADEATGFLSDILFERLRTDHSLCYSVNCASTSLPTFTIGGISVKTSPEHLSRTEREIWNSINEIRDGKWHERFLTLHKLRSDRIKSNERLSENILSSLIQEFNIHKHTTSLATYLAEVESISHEETLQWIDNFFQKDMVWTEVIFPKK